MDRYFTSGAAPRVIDGEYKVLGQSNGRHNSHSDSRALVVHHGASQPADNRRLPGTLTGAAAARGMRQDGRFLDPGFTSGLNAAFLDDGEDALTTLAAAIGKNTAAIQSAQNQAVQLERKERARRQAQEVARREKEEELRRKHEMHDAIMSWLRRGSSEPQPDNGQSSVTTDYPAEPYPTRGPKDWAADEARWAKDEARWEADEARRETVAEELLERGHVVVDPAGRNWRERLKAERAELIEMAEIEAEEAEPVRRSKPDAFERLLADRKKAAPPEPRSQRWLEWLFSTPATSTWR